MSALTPQTLGVLVHGLRLRGESYAADVIERLAAPATDAQVEAAATEIYISRRRGSDGPRLSREALLGGCPRRARGCTGGVRCLIVSLLSGSTWPPTRWGSWSRILPRPYSTPGGTQERCSRERE